MDWASTQGPPSTQPQLFVTITSYSEVLHDNLDTFVHSKLDGGKSHSKSNLHLQYKANKNKVEKEIDEDDLENYKLPFFLIACSSTHLTNRSLASKKLQVALLLHMQSLGWTKELGSIYYGKWELDMTRGEFLLLEIVQERNKLKKDLP